MFFHLFCCVWLFLLFNDIAFNFNIPPDQQWVNQSSPVALLGHVHCFFPGLPNSELNVTAEHIGRYDCKFEKHPSSYDRSFDINEMRKPRPDENWVIDGSKLTIFDVKQGAGGVGDNAVYQCKVENRHGYLWTNFYLNLLAVQPKLIEEPGQVEAIQGRPFSLSCKFFASPLAKVAWESPVLKGTDYTQRVDQFGTGWLIFENVLPSYEGEYKCTGTNKYGSASGNIRLVVRNVPPPVSSARILECNQTDPLVTITFEHLEPEERTKPVEEFWLRFSCKKRSDDR